jgi:hypothetical protein
MGTLPSWELREIADAVLDQGFYSPVIGELATMRHPVMANAGPLFERALQELHTEMPSREDAVWILLRHHIGRIASRDVSPREGLRFVVDVYYLTDLYDKSREYVGDSHGIQQLIGYFWGYDDLEERPREVSFDGDTEPMPFRRWIRRSSGCLISGLASTVPNERLERPGVIAGADVEAFSAGRSADHR